jgi:hypothetical protein
MVQDYTSSGNLPVGRAGKGGNSSKYYPCNNSEIADAILKESR